MEDEYGKLLDVNADLIELMYGVRRPLAVDGDSRHPLEDFVFSYDRVMADPVRVLALYTALGLYAPPEEERISPYFYLALKGILDGERSGRYPRSFPSVGEMHRFTHQEFLAWAERFLRARKVAVPKELLYRLTVDDIYADRMTVFLYYNRMGCDDDPFKSTRITHSGEALDYFYFDNEDAIRPPKA